MLSGCGGGGGGDGAIPPPQQPPPVPQKKANVVLYGSSFNRTVDHDDNVKLLGELINIGSVDACFCKITFTFKNSTGYAVGTDYNYVFASTKTIVLSDSEIDSILKPNEISGFVLYTDFPSSNVSSYSYIIGWDEYETSQPDAQVILNSAITESIGIFDKLQLSGNLKNVGDQIAVFTYITFILKDAYNKIIDLSSYNFIDGSTIYLPSIDDTTDTALYPGETSFFDTWTILVTPSEVSSYYHKTAWTDYNPTSSRQKKSFGDPVRDLTPRELWEQRRKRIDELKASLNNLE